MTKKKLQDFKTQRANANKHTERGIALLDKSIRQDGWIGAVTVANDGETFDGSARLERIGEVMAKSDPIVVDVDGTRPVILRRTDIASADDPRAKRLAVAANAIASADWNPDGDLLAQLAAEDDYIAQLVKSDDKAAKAVLEAGNAGGNADAEPQIDRAEELREKWGTATGQLWRIGQHRLLCGDSTKREDVERVMGGEKAGACVTDPNYGLGDSKSFNENHEDYEDEEPFDLTLLDLSCPFVVWGGNYYETLPDKRNKIGWLVWDKRPDLEGEKRERADRRFGQHFEIAITNIGELRGKMLRHRWGGYYGSEEILHKTQKPVALMLDCISPTQGYIIDYFAGSGTTLVACQNLSRRCRAIEISPAYCAVILERMQIAFPSIEIELVND